MSNHTDSNEQQGESHHLLIVRDHYHVDTLGHIAERRCSCSLNAPPHRYVCAVCVDIRSRASVAAVAGDAISRVDVLRVLQGARECGGVDLRDLIAEVNRIPAAASSPASPVQPTPEQIVYNVAQRDPRFRKHLIEQLTALGDEQDTGPLRTLAAPLQPAGEQESGFPWGTCISINGESYWLNQCQPCPSTKQPTYHVIKGEPQPSLNELMDGDG